MDLIARIRALGWDPIEETIKIIRTNKTMKPAVKAKLCLTLAEFMYPRRKAIETPPEKEQATDVTYVAEWGNRHEPSDANDD